MDAAAKFQQAEALARYGEQDDPDGFEYILLVAREGSQTAAPALTPSRRAPSAWKILNWRFVWDSNATVA